VSERKEGKSGERKEWKSGERKEWKSGERKGKGDDALPCDQTDARLMLLLCSLSPPRYSIFSLSLYT